MRRVKRSSMSSPLNTCQIQTRDEHDKGLTVGVFRSRRCLLSQLRASLRR